MGIFQGRYGIYLGKVVDNYDPELKSRIKVRTFEDEGIEDADLPWCETIFFSGGPNQTSKIPEKDDAIYVKYVAGQAQFPVMDSFARNAQHKRNPLLADQPYIVERKSHLGTITYWENDENPSFGYYMGNAGEFAIKPDGFVLYDIFKNAITSSSNSISIRRGGKQNAYVNIKGEDIELAGNNLAFYFKNDFDVQNSGSTAMISGGDHTITANNNINLNATVGKLSSIATQGYSFNSVGDFETSSGTFLVGVTGNSKGVPKVFQDAISFSTLIGNIVFSTAATGGIEHNVGPFGLIASSEIDFLGSYEFSNAVGGEVSCDLLGNFYGGNYLGEVSVSLTGAIEASNFLGGLSVNTIGNTKVGNIIPLGQIRTTPASTSIGLGLFPMAQWGNPAQLSVTLMGPQPIVTGSNFTSFV